MTALAQFLLALSPLVLRALSKPVYIAPPPKPAPATTQKGRIITIVVCAVFLLIIISVAWWWSRREKAKKRAREAQKAAEEDTFSSRDVSIRETAGQPDMVHNPLSTPRSSYVRV